MPPKTAKSGQNSKPPVQTEEENLASASKKLTVPETQCEFNAATNDDILSAIQSLKADFTKQSTDMLEAINGIKSDLLSQSQRIGEAEERITQTEEDVSDLQNKVKKLEETTEFLRSKVQDLEDRGRRSNLRLVGLPEKIEGSNMCAFIEDLLPKVLNDAFSSIPVIERAHRVGQVNPNRPTTPRAIVMKFLNYQDKEKALRAARKLKELRYEGQRISLFPDLSAETRQRQRQFDGVKAQLRGMEIRYGILYPAHLIVTHSGQRHIFKSVSEAEDLIGHCVLLLKYCKQMGLHSHVYQTKICRGSPTSGHGVEIFLQAEQKILSLVIDSLNAAIYWTTETSVEGCRLDGEDYQLLDKLSVFSGKEVAGITLNVIEGNLYWLVQDGSLLNLYRVNISPLRMQSKVVEFPRWTTSQISYHQVGSYSGRLVWLDENKQLRIQELNQNNSVLMSSSKTLTAFSVVQQMLKPLPDGFVSPPLVIPPAVSKIVLEGNDTFFQIHWEHSSVDYGTVIYCVVSKELWKNVEQLQNKYPTRYCHPVNTFSEAAINVTRFKPGAKFNITITPFTYWGRGESTQTTFITPGTSLDTDMTLIILIVSVAAGFTLIILIVAAVIWHRHHKKKDHGTVTQTGVHIHPDVELEYIRGLVGLGNACFAISAIPAQGDIESLPVFPRECLKLQRLLGSGAFGEVYEGVIVGNQITEIVPERRVAVKTLRKDASDYEKTEFLKEAHLMSQFNHPNILRLLGVCLLNEPHYLILELMEGGDLQSYLRGARPTNTHKELLNLTSLLDISLDAATGCAYLERMHFVHRDIAARNCLVSVRSYIDPERVVKIGDFGLARDVYKNDYYRKKGEGLLPVRWMSPESLTDGIFNKYSDVWAFSVLLWEIMTLGKLPYPTYTNHEVLSLISTGVRLPSPAGCPQRLYNLMMSCWSKEPTERPNFQYLEETLRKLRDYEEDKRANQNGHVNQAYQEDEEEVCTGVDEDEVLETGLSPVLSNEGLNYLMYRAQSPDSVRTDTSTPTEDR